MKIFIASTNAHKIGEYREMFAACNLHCDVCGADAVAGFSAPDENGDSFRANALIKAEALAEKLRGEYVMADDSGIVVDALGGAPGIYSARYAGCHGPDTDLRNNEKLLNELKDVPDEKRTARFVCCIALVAPDGSEHCFEGTIEGRINRGAAGCGGFGYDPLFYVPELGKTTAEISPEHKNAISHRGRAFAKLAEFLKNKNG